MFFGTRQGRGWGPERNACAASDQNAAAERDMPDAPCSGVTDWYSPAVQLTAQRPATSKVPKRLSNSWTTSFLLVRSVWHIGGLDAEPIHPYDDPINVQRSTDKISSAGSSIDRRLNVSSVITSSLSSVIKYSIVPSELNRPR